MEYKIYKGLNKLLIKESKKKELEFDEEQLKSIKASAEVKLYKKKNGWKIFVWSKYGEDCYWGGCFDWDDVKKEGEMKVFSGFAGNLIGKVDRHYNCTRPQGTTYKDEFQTLLLYMCKARVGSLTSMNCYSKYVAATGDMS